MYSIKNKILEDDFVGAAKIILNDLNENNLHTIKIPDEMSFLNTNNIVKKVISELEEIINNEAKTILKKYLLLYKIYTNFNFEI